MSNEVELKLAVTPDAFDTLKTHLNQFKILEQNTVFLGNTYFDYPDHFLAKQKMGLRVRQENNDFTLTLKTDGKVFGGLHSRPEYNLSIPDNSVPTSAQLMSLYPFENLPSATLQPIFSTDFNRTFWLIAFGASKIEVAFDQGKILSGEKPQPICEIEFELKEGLVSDLFHFVSLLPFEQDVYFSSASKAKRGYQLGSKPLLIDWLNKWRDFLKEEREGSAVDSRQKLSAVMKMEQQLIEETLSFPTDVFAFDFMKTVERVGAFFNLYHYYDDNKTLFEKLEGSQSAELLASNQFFLNEIKRLITFHSETKDNAQTIEKLKVLLKSRAYFERMLGLMMLMA